MRHDLTNIAEKLADVLELSPDKRIRADAKKIDELVSEYYSLSKNMLKYAAMSLFWNPDLIERDLYSILAGRPLESPYRQAIDRMDTILHKIDCIAYNYPKKMAQIINESEIPAIVKAPAMFGVGNY